MDKTTERCVEEYASLKNLKLVGESLGIPWQTVYVKLKNSGVQVVGDKARYGSGKDKLAVKAESLFHEKIPYAINNNEEQFQANIDFVVKGCSVDIKASRLRTYPSKRNTDKWGFCVNKQKDKADIFICYAFDSKGEEVLHLFLIPGEVARGKTTISVPKTLNSNR